MNLTIHLKINKRDFNHSVGKETTTKLFSDMGQEQVIVNVVECNHGVNTLIISGIVSILVKESAKEDALDTNG